MWFWLRVFYWIVLAFFSQVFYRLIRKRAEYNFRQLENDYLSLDNNRQELNDDCINLKQRNAELEKHVEETSTLYDLTKEMCKSLDTDTLFNSFKDYLNARLGVNECKFFEDDAEIDVQGNYTIVPVEIEKKSLGFLVLDKINPEMNDKFQILLGQFIMGLKRALLYRRVNELAITDSLTGLSSRRYFLEKLKEEIERSQKLKRSFSFLIVDVDHFKNANDRYGHFVGDAILKELAKAIQENTRQIDLSARYGGDEFVIVLEETGQAESGLIAERIRASIATHNFKAYDEDLRVSVSIGIAVFPADGKDAASLIKHSDQALYRAKGSGRNKVGLYS